MNISAPIHLCLTILPMSPCILSSRGKFYLVLPTTIRSLEKKYPAMLNAILAHELAHVLHKDASVGRFIRIVLAVTNTAWMYSFLTTDIWMLGSYLFNTHLGADFRVHAGVILWLFRYVALAFIVAYATEFWNIVFLWVGMTLFRRALYGSEYLADKAAVLLGGAGTDLADALDQLHPHNKGTSHPDGFSETHPPSTKRKQRIHQLQQRLTHIHSD